MKKCRLDKTVVATMLSLPDKQSLLIMVLWAVLRSAGVDQFAQKRSDDPLCYFAIRLSVPVQKVFTTHLLDVMKHTVTTYYPKLIGCGLYIMIVSIFQNVASQLQQSDQSKGTFES